MITVLRNRIGDVGIIIRIVFICYYGTWDILSFTNLNISTILVGLLIILASITKRAQLPFSA